MNNERFNQIVTEGAERRAKILCKKGSDYDKIDSDRLSSFKKVANILNELEVDGHTDHTATGVATTLLTLKQVRDTNLKSSGRPTQNESRQDTIDDWHNYIDLKTGCEIDEEEAKPKEGGIDLILEALELGREISERHGRPTAQTQTEHEVLCLAIREWKGKCKSLKLSPGT